MLVEDTAVTVAAGFRGFSSVWRVDRVRGEDEIEELWRGYVAWRSLEFAPQDSIWGVLSADWMAPLSTDGCRGWSGNGRRRRALGGEERGDGKSREGSCSCDGSVGHGVWGSLSSVLSLQTRGGQSRMTHSHIIPGQYVGAL